MRATSIFRASLLLVLFGAGACGDVGAPLTINATGTLAARAFLDRNGNNQVDVGIDAPAVGLRLSVLRGSSDTVATGVTDAAGSARFLGLPVGSYRLAVSPTVLGDSLRLAGVDSSRVTVAVADSGVVRLTLSYPIVTATQVQALALGRPVTLEGIALHASNVFGDSTIHVLDASGVARVVGVPARIAASVGDSVRVLGRIGTFGGRAALVEASAFVLSPSQPPVARVVTTSEAARARGGALDGALVRIPTTQVISVTSLTGGDIRLRVTDGSGPLEVLLDRDARISTEEPIVAGVQLGVTGILVPKEGTSEWMLKPRGSRDVEVTIPTATIAEARRLAAGNLISISAVALNGLATFGDNTVHFVDPSGSIRALNATSSFLFAGDSVRVLGVLSIREGQPVLTPATVTVLGKSTLPPPAFVNTEVAAKANDGKLDAALIEVRNALVESVSTTTADAQFVVNDGSGALVVTIDRDTGIGTGGIAKGDRLDVVGLLTPTGRGTWVLKPRSPADITRR